MNNLLKRRILAIGIASLFLLGGFFGLFSLISCEVSAGGPTEVSGVFFSDTTWTLSESPYIVIGDVQIANGVTLTIEPGVNIQYKGAYEILIKGTIIANGNTINPIIFTSSIPQTSSGARMLMFKDTNLSNSQLSYIKMEYADKCIQIGEETEHNQGEKNIGTLTVSHFEINEATILTDGYKTGAKLVLTDGVINSSTIKGNYPRSEEIIIQNAVISNCDINSDGYNKGITIKDSSVTNSRFILGCSPANIHIINSLIKESDFRVGDGNPVKGPLEITNTTLINTPVNLPVVTLEVSNSIVSYNGSNGLIFGTGFIENSLIIGKNKGVAVNITGYNGYNIGGSVTITNSTITHNYIGIRITNANVITVQNNNIVNNTKYNLENLASKDIIASNNYWGTSNTNGISAAIFDYYDNINYGKVLFNPFKTSALDLDSDNDGINDSIDADDDGDGYLDENDVFPLDPSEWQDNDNDGLGDNADTDDDNDGISDPQDKFPNDASEWLDSDSDGIGDNSDTDIDGDGYINSNDDFPMDPDEWQDTDNDGTGDNTDTDIDNDGMPNDWEDAYGLDRNDSNDANTDFDNDGLTNLEEFQYNVNPNDNDTDNDKLPDGWEVGYGLNSNNSTGDNGADGDIDKDGYSNLEEFEANTDPTDPADHPIVKPPPTHGDSDKDGLPDNWETDNFGRIEIYSGDDDPDGDGHNNYAEWENNTDPLDPEDHPETSLIDTDDDGTPDYVDEDDDNDGLPDTWEKQNGFNPLVYDAGEDTDMDGYTNLEEYKAGTDPLDNSSVPFVPPTDTDGDSVPDTLDDDDDDDGYTDTQELDEGTDPLDKTSHPVKKENGDRETFGTTAVILILISIIFILVFINIILLSRVRKTREGLRPPPRKRRPPY